VSTSGGDGFEEAFDQLFPRAFRMARRMLGDAAAAEDVAAEAMARA
jgi:DNA-directed RNA polymerase specialized sigma24 family protein